MAMLISKHLKSSVGAKCRKNDLMRIIKPRRGSDLWIFLFGFGRVVLRKSFYKQSGREPAALVLQQDGTAGGFPYACP